MIKCYCLLHYSREKPFHKFAFGEQTISHSCRVETLLSQAARRPATE